MYIIQYVVYITQYTEYSTNLNMFGVQSTTDYNIILIATSYVCLIAHNLLGFLPFWEGNPAQTLAVALVAAASAQAPAAQSVTRTHRDRYPAQGESSGGRPRTYVQPP